MSSGDVSRSFLNFKFITNYGFHKIVQIVLTYRTLGHTTRGDDTVSSLSLSNSTYERQDCIIVTDGVPAVIEGESVRKLSRSSCVINVKLKRDLVTSQLLIVLGRNLSHMLCKGYLKKNLLSREDYSRRLSSSMKDRPHPPLSDVCYQQGKGRSFWQVQDPQFLRW